MIRAVLFDLDGTLLDIDVDVFLREYFAALGPVLASLAGTSQPHDALKAIVASTDTMCEPHPGRTNREVFHRRFLQLTGIDLDEPESAARIERFYAEAFPGLGRAHGPRPGGIEAVHAAHASGCRVALATNPIFPRAAVNERMRWAGLEQTWFAVVTSYENMRACKPQVEYFAQTAEMLAVDPEECLMVGDDPGLDFGAAHIGMRTFYVGRQPEVESTWRGSLADLASLLDRLQR